MSDFNLTALIHRENIAKIECFVSDRISVVLKDGRVGVGGTVAEALDKAKADNPGAAIAALRRAA